MCFLNFIATSGAVMLDLMGMIRIIFDNLQATFKMPLLPFSVSGNGKTKSMGMTSHLDSGGSIRCNSRTVCGSVLWFFGMCDNSSHSLQRFSSYFARSTTGVGGSEFSFHRDVQRMVSSGSRAIA